MLSFLNIGVRIRKWKLNNDQLNLYYPKGIYDRLARREMRVILVRFNDLFFTTYPERLTGKGSMLLDYKPKTYANKHEIQRQLALYKIQKVRKKELAKIEEYLKTKSMIEEQIAYYTGEIQEAMYTKRQISEEAYAELFPQIFERRIAFLEEIEGRCLGKLEHLTKEKRICDDAIEALLNNPQDFWGDTGRLLKGMVAESVKQVVDQTFRKK